MSDFEYLSVLIAIIVGIGIAHLLLSLGRILGEAKSLNIGWVQMLWTANTLLTRRHLLRHVAVSQPVKMRLRNFVR